MATSGPTNLPAFFAADSDFRTWGAGINAALAAIGLVQTADTGQINWTTVTKPAAINTAQGYEVWRLNDSFQATVPCYIKLEYGSGNTVDRPMIWMTVGTATNGAGTLSGQLCPRVQVGGTVSSTSGTQLPSYFSGDGSRFSASVNHSPTLTTTSTFLSVERTRDSTGAYTGDGVVAMWASSQTTGFQVIPPTGTVPSPAVGALPVIPVDTAAASPGNQHVSVAGDIALGTTVCFIGKPVFGLGVTCVNRADIGVVTSTFTATVLGASHTFIALGAYTTKYSAQTSDTTDYLGMLWE